MKNIKIGDVVVISLILLVTAGVFGFRLLGFECGEFAVVSFDGRETVYSLSEDRRLDLKGNGVSFTLVIENGAVFVESSDCPEQSCVRMGRISKKGQSVACVPAKLYVKITGGDGSGYDAIIG